MSDDVRDRRASPRVRIAFPVNLRDLTRQWKGDVVDLSTSGCLVSVPGRIGVGQGVQLDLRPPRMEPVALRGQVIHASPGGAHGIGFLCDRPGELERAIDLFEGLVALNPALAVEVSRRPSALPRATRLYAVPDAKTEPRPDERKLLLHFVAGKSLGELEQALGDRAPSAMWLVFSMLDRGLLTQVRPNQIRSR